MNNTIIPNAKLALELLHQNILISKNYGGETSLYARSSNNSILVNDKYLPTYNTILLGIKYN